MCKCIWVAMLLLVLACEKPDKKYLLPPRPADSVEVTQIELGEDYENQVYINLLDSSPIKSSVKCNSWDLAFDCSNNGYKITMNGGKGVLIGTLGKEMEKTRFNQNVVLNKVKWRWDEASGGDSIVLNHWLDQFQHSYDSIYIIDRGKDCDPDFRYFQFKVEFGAFGFDDYLINVADLKGRNLYVALLHKDPSKNVVFFDFGKPAGLNFEPYNQNWHICFLRYRYVYYEFSPPLLYTVTGININPRTMSVAIDSSMKFEDIRLKDVEALKYSSKRDAIGFDWKIYDFVQGRYKTRNYVTYLLKIKGLGEAYYKLRFTDFYSTKGVKGSPKYEISRVK